MFIAQKMVKITSELPNNIFQTIINTNFSRKVFLSYSEELSIFKGCKLAKSFPKYAVRISVMSKSFHSVHNMFMNQKAQREISRDSQGLENSSDKKPENTTA